MIIGIKLFFLNFITYHFYFAIHRFLSFFAPVMWPIHMLTLIYIYIYIYIA